MLENIVFLAIGSLIGLAASAITIWMQHKLELKRRREQRIYDEKQQMIEDARQFMKSQDLDILRYGSSGSIEFCRLVVEQGTDRGKDFSVKKNVVVWGKSNDLCDYVLSDSEIADAHLRLIITDNVYVLEDISGVLGTHVNDTLMTRPIQLEDRDLVKIGNSSLRFYKAK